MIPPKMGLSNRPSGIMKQSMVNATNNANANNLFTWFFITYCLKDNCLISKGD